ncbi:MAG: ABC transporter ATP-binding protein [Thermodesulforhabdaceae bacterium]|jgi:branched-chain amino acid transport system ATP-binding protein
MLAISDLHVYYGGIHAVKGISLRVDQGQIVTIIGANGAGKSTTIRAIVGLVRARSGSITFKGKAIHRMPTHEIIRLGIGISPEGRKVFANLTVMENLELGAYNLPKSEFKERVEWIFSLFPRLAERSKQLAGTLSGGEQQMLSLGRALMGKPELLLLDEPSLGLAPLVVEEVFRTILEINNQGTTILLVEQNAMAALAIAHYAYVMETGNIVLEGKGTELLEDERVRKAYLGE